MAAKILAGAAAMVLVAGVGIYAATGSIPGVETVADQLVASAPTGECCGAKSGCSLAASACPLETPVPTVVSEDGLGACAGSGLIAGVGATAKSPCCAE